MADKQDIHLSVVISAFNESENVFATAARIHKAFADRPWKYEIVFVDDGSSDNTSEHIAKLAEQDTTVVATGYPANAGRGKALRTGFDVARGRYVASVDADLSYHPPAILDLLDALEAHPDVGFALGSPYMSGGSTQGVPLNRLLISKLGNHVLRRLMPGRFHTYTGIFRCCRREVLDALVLKSDGKEIHLEIVTKSLALGFKAIEVPAVLHSRKKGKSKFRLKRTA